MLDLTRSIVLALSLSSLGAATLPYDPTPCSGADYAIQKQNVVQVMCSKDATIYEPSKFSIGLPDGYSTWYDGAFSGAHNHMVHVSTGNKTQDEALYALQILGGGHVLREVLSEKSTDRQRLAEFADHVFEVYERTHDYYPDFEGDWREVYHWSEQEAGYSVYLSGFRNLFDSVVEAGKNVLLINK